jgi:DNA-binding response OmpR family regulator
MGLNLLIADDDPGIRSLLQQAAAQRGHQVVLAADGAEALERIKEQRPDAISLDLQMPRLDGRDVIARLKRDASLKTIPVIVVTSIDDEYTRQLCLEMGADDVVEKPFDVRHLLTRFEFLVEKHRARGQPT